MARIRSYKPEIHTDNKTGNLTDTAWRLFLGLMTYSDDEGVIAYDPGEFKAQIFPYRPKTVLKKIVESMEELINSGLLTVFAHEESSRVLGNTREYSRVLTNKPFILIKNFKKHQKVEHPRLPTIKGFSEKMAYSSEIKNLSGFLASTRESSGVLAPEGRKEGGIRGTGYPQDHVDNSRATEPRPFGAPPPAPIDKEQIKKELTHVGDTIKKFTGTSS